MEKELETNELAKLMKEVKMNESTITGVLYLLKTQKDINKIIKYIQRNKDLITDHQLRQYMVRILLWDKEN